MKKKNYKILIVVLLSILLVTGCTTQLTDSENKAVNNPTTGQSLTKNILCRPEDEETISLYTDNGVDLEELPKCEEFSIGSGGYEGLWTSILVKPLAWVIIQFGNIVKNYGLGLIITSLLIRLVVFPLTRKTAMQSELMKEAKPKLDKLEKKYAGKTDQQSMTLKANEMMAIYKEYKISPFSGCLFAFLQIPLFIAFLEAINRVPAIFENSFWKFQLGTTPLVGIKNGNYFYIILIILILVFTVLSFKNSMSSMGGSSEQMKQTKYMLVFMTIFIGIASIQLPSAIALYWVVTNAFNVVQMEILKKVG